MTHWNKPHIRYLDPRYYVGLGRYIIDNGFSILFSGEAIDCNM